MKPIPPPPIQGNTDSERFKNALHKVLSTPPKPQPQPKKAAS